MIYFGEEMVTDEEREEYEALLIESAELAKAERYAVDMLMRTFEREEEYEYSF